MNLNLEQEFGERLTTLSNGAKGLRGQISMRASVPAGVDGAVIDMRASDETLDRYNEIIVAAGWKLENYGKNPVIQNSHNYGDIIHTIGKALRTEVTGTELVQRWQFAVEENPVARIAYGLYRGGYLNTSSVGFIPLKWENGGDKTGYRRKYLEQELLEVSAVGIPANPNALALAVKSGAVEKSDLEELRNLLDTLAEKRDAKSLQEFSKGKADTETDASTTGPGVDVVQSMRLLLTLQLTLHELKQ